MGFARAGAAKVPDGTSSRLDPAAHVRDAAVGETSERAQSDRSATISSPKPIKGFEESLAGDVSVRALAAGAPDRRRQGKRPN